MALAFVLGGLTTFVALNALFRIKDAKIARSRVGYGVNDFLEYFSKQQVPGQIALEVYQYFQELQTRPGFPAHPRDDLYKVYGIWHEDLDDAVLELAKKCGCKTPTNELLDGIAPIKSIEDLVRLLVHLCKE
ncbi:MAG: hypothetical protein ACRD9S_18810 [Pyrinomonadaceae bacterium]